MTKPHLKRKPDGGLYSASELAMMRTLDKAGMTMEEYVRRLDSLRDENGSPHCENCGQVEKKRKPNGEIKNLAPNLEQKKRVLVQGLQAAHEGHGCEAQRQRRCYVTRRILVA